MFWFYFGVYSFILLIVWGFYFVARVHAMKFRNFSSSIPKMTNLLFFALLFLSILGAISIYYLSGGLAKTTFEVESKPLYNKESFDKANKADYKGENYY